MAKGQPGFLEKKGCSTQAGGVGHRSPPEPTRVLCCSGRVGWGPAALRSRGQEPAEA